MSHVEPHQPQDGARPDARTAHARRAGDAFARQNQLRIERLHQLLPAAASLALHQLPTSFGLTNVDSPGTVDSPLVEPSAHRVQAMYAMGSAGTLAQNAQSDLDLWLITHTPDHPTLKSHVAQVTRQCHEQGLDVRPYLVNPEQFSGNQTAHSRTNPDDCGTTQRHLLLDEFYRTCIQLAGPRLRWWADDEADRDAAIELGALGSPPVTEFVGAAMWHLHKALQAPQKSYIKLLLLEVYATGGPWSLAAAYRDALRQKGRQGAQPAATQEALGADDALDPYLFLLEFLAEHLSEPEHRPRLQVARQGLLYRASVGAHAQPLWRLRLIERLCQQWDLRSPFLDLGRNQNPMEQLQSQELAFDVLRNHQRALQQQIERSQALLRQAGARLPEQSVSREHLQLLSAEVQAETESLPGKLALLPPPVRKRLPARHVRLQPLDSGQWRSSQGPEAGLLNAPLVPTICWLARNDLRLDSASDPAHVSLLERLHVALEQYPPADMLRPAVPIGGCLIGPAPGPKANDGSGEAHQTAADASAWLLLTNSWHEHFIVEVAATRTPYTYGDDAENDRFEWGHLVPETLDRHLARWALQANAMEDIDGRLVQPLQPKRGHRVGVLPRRIEVRLSDQSASYTDSSNQMHRTPATALAPEHRAQHWKLFLANASRRLGVAITIADTPEEHAAKPTAHLRHDLCAIVHPVVAPGTGTAQITVDIRAGNQLFSRPLSTPSEMEALLRTVNAWRNPDEAPYPITLTDLSVPRLERWRLHHLLMLKYEVEQALSLGPDALVRH